MNENKEKKKVPVGTILVIVGVVLFLSSFVVIPLVGIRGQSMEVVPTLFVLPATGFLLCFIGGLLSKKRSPGRTTTFTTTDLGKTPINDDRRKGIESPVVCPFCGHLNSPNSRFCNQCGKALTRICPKCGKKNDLSSTYCNACGTKLDDNQ